MTCPHYVCSQPWQCTGPRDDGDHHGDDAEDDDGEDEDGADDHDDDDDDDDEEEEEAALKDVEKGGEEECPSVRTTHAAPDYQEFTAPHSAYSLPWTCTVLTFCHNLHGGTHHTDWPILASTTSHSAKRDCHVTAPTFTHILQLQLTDTNIVQ